MGETYRDCECCGGSGRTDRPSPKLVNYEVERDAALRVVEIRESELHRLTARIRELDAEGERLRDMLKVCRDAINSAPIDTFGEGSDSDGVTWPIRDELVYNISQALGGVGGENMKHTSIEEDRRISRIRVRVTNRTEWGSEYEEIEADPLDEVPRVMINEAGHCYKDGVFVFSTVHAPVKSTLKTWKWAVLEAERLEQGRPDVFWLELRPSGLHITLYWDVMP